MRVVVIVLFCLTSNLLATDVPKENIKPIVHIVSTGRSGSTLLFLALQRQLEHAGKPSSLYNEPGITAFAKKHETKEFYEDWYYANAPFDNIEIAKGIVSDSAKNYVCVKGVSDPCKEFLQQNVWYAKLPNVHFVFLIRKPADLLLSLYRIYPEMRYEDKQWVSLDGVQQAFEIAGKVNTNIHILFFEDLVKHPRNIINSLCERVGYPFSERALTWQALGDNFWGENWHEKKIEKRFEQFHGTLRKCTGFKKPTQYKHDACGQTVFSDVIDDQKRLMLRKINKEFLPAYNFFLRLVEYHIQT